MIKLRISKIEAARRQLDSAIELWFLDKDEVSVHTLAAAAYQLVRQRNDQRRIPQAVDQGHKETDEFFQTR